MKFLVDAQLPVRLARFLQLAGYDTIHPRDLLKQNATPDTEINAVSIKDSRIVITKDSDFFDSFIIRQEPYKLLIVTTGSCLSFPGWSLGMSSGGSASVLSEAEPLGWVLPGWSLVTS